MKQGLESNDTWLKLELNLTRVSIFCQFRVSTQTTSDAVNALYKGEFH